jgi:hypothetical protein
MPCCVRPSDFPAFLAWLAAVDFADWPNDILDRADAGASTSVNISPEANALVRDILTLKVSDSRCGLRRLRNLRDALVGESLLNVTDGAGSM